MGPVSQHKRVTLILLLIACLAGAFWLTSRYPNLNQKAVMGGGTLTEDPLAFNAVIQAQPGDPLHEKIAISSINWAVENRQGMTFGVLLGGGFLTLFALFQRRGSRNAFLNALMGIGVGAPLGLRRTNEFWSSTSGLMYRRCGRRLVSRSCR